jgi:hypothetical protein
LEATYDEYAMCGESENRNKEFKCGMAMDRLSDHRFLADYFRLYLHAAALKLLVRLRREIADPPPANRRCGRGDTTGSGTEAISERTPSPGSAWRRSVGDVAIAPDQGGGLGRRELPPHLGAAERQLAESAVLRAGSSARLSASGRGSLLVRMKRLITRKTNGGKVAVCLGWLSIAVSADSSVRRGRRLVPSGHS